MLCSETYPRPRSFAAHRRKGSREGWRATEREKNHGPIHEVPPVTGSRRIPLSINFSANRDFIMRDHRASILLGRSNRLAPWLAACDAAFLRVELGCGDPCTELWLGKRNSTCTTPLVHLLNRLELTANRAL